MDELYQMIEDKIHAAGYMEPVDGFDIYDELCDQIEEKEVGTYLFMSKKSEDVFFEYKVEVLEEEFNLSYIDIHVKDKVYHVDFDD